ncbi:S-protein homolog 18-like [Durio zibethinus]|uniref:S-protein homolog n=1 Tax=Durio zibethinus TaxID=66656 RepID=A0A6P5X232_DURZI|nr:S-protein homolog 18-like [Durio zibethinus]
MANHKEILLLMLLALCIFFPLAFAVSEDLLFIKYHIHIINDLPSDLPPNVPSVLLLHCKSKDKDLGQRSMLQHEDYTWDSRINLFRTTLFFCQASWEGKQRNFDAFDANRDEHRCREYHNSCLWSVRDDGFYFSNDNSTWTNEYPW